MTIGTFPNKYIYLKLFFWAPLQGLAKYVL
jgi:hypothetical protein